MDYFRNLVDAAGGGNYQTVINDALLEHVHRRSTLDIVRQAIQEELARYKDCLHQGSHQKIAHAALNDTICMDESFATATARMEQLNLKRIESGGHSRWPEPRVRSDQQEKEVDSRTDAVPAQTSRHLRRIATRVTWDVCPPALASGLTPHG